MPKSSQKIYFLLALKTDLLLTPATSTSFLLNHYSSPCICPLCTLLKMPLYSQIAFFLVNGKDSFWLFPHSSSKISDPAWRAVESKGRRGMAIQHSKARPRPRPRPLSQPTALVYLLQSLLLGMWHTKKWATRFHNSMAFDIHMQLTKCWALEQTVLRKYYLLKAQTLN